MKTTQNKKRLKRIAKPYNGLFLVTRSSICGTETKPCDNAFLVEIMVTQRVFKTLKFVVRPQGKSGYCVKDFGTDICDPVHEMPEIHWAVELSDIMSFVAQHGQCILGYYYDYAKIEIYDAHEYII